MRSDTRTALEALLHNVREWRPGDRRENEPSVRAIADRLADALNHEPETDDEGRPVVEIEADPNLLVETELP